MEVNKVYILLKGIKARDEKMEGMRKERDR